MEKYIFDESNGLWYELRGDYYLPYLTLPAEEEQPIGIWASGIGGICGNTSGRFIRRFCRVAG